MEKATSRSLGRGVFHLPPRPISNNLNMAELSIQRGDVEQGRLILERRISQGAGDFKTMNLYGITLAHGRHYDNAITIFKRLHSSARDRTERTKSGFNYGQALFFRDLSVVGDLAITKTLRNTPGRTALPVEYQYPFTRSLKVWESLLHRRSKYVDIILAYVAFCYMQLGYYDDALSHLAASFSKNENFYVSHYVLGRVCFDLFMLSAENNDFGINEHNIRFFEIEPDEVSHKQTERLFVVRRETLLDIAIQAFHDARQLSPLTPCIYHNLCEAYMFAGLVDEAHEAMAHAEMMAPNSPATLEVTLQFHEYVRSPPDVISGLLDRIKQVRGHEHDEVYNIIPSYYLF